MPASSAFAPSANVGAVPGGFVAPLPRVASLTRRPRFVVSRPVAAAPAPAAQVNRTVSRPLEKTPPKYGEKPYEQMVKEAFEGPSLRLSRRMELLEKAAERRIRRGDALDLMDAIRRENEDKTGVRRPSAVRVFAARFAAFAAVYVVVALAWCLVLAR
jgi:hypothetical protein